MKRVLSALIALVMFVAYQPLPITALAQNNGEIAGTAVVEGKPLAKITVRLRNVDSGQLVGNQTTNERGEFGFYAHPHSSSYVFPDIGAGLRVTNPEGETRPPHAPVRRV